MGINKELIKRIKACFNAGYSCAEIAKKFKLSESVVRIIKNSK